MHLSWLSRVSLWHCRFCAHHPVGGDCLLWIRTEVYLQLANYNKIIRSAIYLRQALFTAFFKSGKQPFRERNRQRQDWETKLEGEWVHFLKPKELKNWRPWIWTQVDQIPKPFALHLAVSHGPATLSLIVLSLMRWLDPWRPDPHLRHHTVIYELS